MLLFAFVVAALFYLALWSLKFSFQKGMFKILAEAPNRFAFRTDFGRFQIRSDPPRLLVAPNSGHELDIPLDQLRGLAYCYEQRPAWLSESTARFDPRDLFDRHTDLTRWFTIEARLLDGRRVVVFAAGQYELQDLFPRWWHGFQIRALAIIGFYDSVERYGLEVLDRLRDRFAAAGRPLPLI